LTKILGKIQKCK